MLSLNVQNFKHLYMFAAPEYWGIIPTTTFLLISFPQDVTYKLLVYSQHIVISNVPDAIPLSLSYFEYVYCVKFLHSFHVYILGQLNSKKKKRNMLMDWTCSKEMCLALCYAYLISEPAFCFSYLGYTPAVNADCTLTQLCLCMGEVFEDNICVIFS